jgi:hypothetical protein
MKEFLFPTKKFLVLFAWVAVFSGLAADAMADTTIFPASTNDFGSGAAVQTQWYSPGGIPGMGLFVGHANSITRNDRSVFRFDLSRFALNASSSNTLASVVLAFEVREVYGKTDARKVEISLLEYETAALSGDDVVNSKLKVVETRVVSRADFRGQIYRVDVTSCVNANLWRGCPSIIFRFRDVQAETSGNVDVQSTGIQLQDGVGHLPHLEIEKEQHAI